ncbi:MAG: hypothetical protein K0S65_4543 [Labilithrix sp.]|nr:hypothetical protein [Labilithrix sp.]
MRALLALETVAIAAGLGMGLAYAGESGSNADAPLKRIELRYTAPRECPSRKALTDAVARRIEPTWLTRSDLRRFAVLIVRNDDGSYKGRLDVEHSGRTRGREIRATSCGDVTAALVVFIAIALDPVTADEPDELQSSLPPAAPGPKERFPPASTSSEKAAVPSRPSPPPSTIVRPDARRTNVSSSSPSWTWSSGAAVTYFRVPESAWGARVSAQIARHFVGGRLSPALRVSWGFADFATFPERAGEVAFRYETAQLAGCMVADFAPIPLTLTPCAGADLGTLQSTARDLRRGAHVEGPWRAANLFVHAAWAFLPWLSLELEAGALFPFERNTYALSQPTRVAYRAPSILFGSGVGLGMHAHFR